MAPMLLLALLLALLEALLLLLLTPLTSVDLSQLSERLALFGKRLLRLGGRAVLFQLPRDLALAPLGIVNLPNSINRRDCSLASSKRCRFPGFRA